jgi:hypothetical protein
VRRSRTGAPGEIGLQDRMPARMQLAVPLPPPLLFVDNISLTQCFSKIQASNFALDVAPEIL